MSTLQWCQHGAQGQRGANGQGLRVPQKLGRVLQIADWSAVDVKAGADGQQACTHNTSMIVNVLYIDGCQSMHRHTQGVFHVSCSISTQRFQY
jgi:hypothetical protein